MDRLQIEKVHLRNVGPFIDLMIEFPRHYGLSLICGDNGIGKTTVLESIAAAFSRGPLQRLTRRQGADAGKLVVHFSVNGSSDQSEVTLDAFEPGVQQYISPPGMNLSRGFINIRASRDFFYTRQDNISRDPTIQHYEFGDRVNAGLFAHDIKPWFANRYLLSPHAETSSWTPAMLDNLQTAISFFSTLDPDVTFDRVDVRTFDIIVRTPNGLIPFEYLSSGFRSAYILLLGILKEIEFRGLDVAAKDFEGIIIIDEIDLHLHPTWQQQIGSALKRAYPKAQIIATTHSPHVIQAAQASEVVALVREAGGTVRQRKVASSKFGYAGWTLEEVLEDIMGVQHTKTSVFRNALVDFDTAVDRDDAEDVVSALKILREMLHPHNPTRKLIEIQAAPYLGEVSESETER